MTTSSYRLGKLAALDTLGVAPDAELFAEVMNQDDTEADVDRSTMRDEDRQPNWSGDASIEGGDAGTRNHEMGIPSSGAV